jgi:hypothetical protein
VDARNQEGDIASLKKNEEEEEEDSHEPLALDFRKEASNPEVVESGIPHAQ